MNAPIPRSTEPAWRELDVITHSLRSLLAPGGDEFQAISRAIMARIMEGFHTRDLPLKIIAYRQAAAAAERAGALLARPDRFPSLTAAQRRRLQADLGALDEVLAALVRLLAAQL